MRHLPTEVLQQEVGHLPPPHVRLLQPMQQVRGEATPRHLQGHWQEAGQPLVQLVPPLQVKERNAQAHEAHAWSRQLEGQDSLLL